MVVTLATPDSLHTAVVIFPPPSTLDANITVECNTGHILSAFKTPSLPNFRCSGLGLVPKHDGGWRTIYHLSALYGSSITDSVDPSDHTLSYCSVDDAFAIVSALGKGTLMAKIDLKMHFISFLCDQRTGTFLASSGGTNSTLTLACHLALDLHPSCSIN